jgi:hypothetical protein
MSLCWSANPAMAQNGPLPLISPGAAHTNVTVRRPYESLIQPAIAEALKRYPLKVDVTPCIEGGCENANDFANAAVGREYERAPLVKKLLYYRVDMAATDGRAIERYRTDWNPETPDNDATYRGVNANKPFIVKAPGYGLHSIRIQTKSKLENSLAISWNKMLCDARRAPVSTTKKIGGVNTAVHIPKLAATMVLTSEPIVVDGRVVGLRQVWKRPTKTPTMSACEEEAGYVESEPTIMTFDVSGHVNIVAMGDSYSSGEGAPGQSPMWSEPFCHRSSVSSRAQAFNTLNRMISDATGGRFQGRFIDKTCSGARIDVGLLGSHGGVPNIVREGGVLRLETRPDGQDFPPQLDEAVRSLPGEEDAHIIILSVGGNDVGFSYVVRKCATRDCTRDHDLLNVVRNGDSVWEDDNPLVGFTGHRVNLVGTRGLPGKFDELARRIGENERLNRAMVFITKYPDPGRDSQGNRCTDVAEEVIENAGNVATACTSVTSLWGLGDTLGNCVDAITHTSDDQEPISEISMAVTRAEWDWVRSHVVDPVNNAIDALVRNRSGWRAVETSSAFARNGLCVPADGMNGRRFNTIVDSVAIQHDYIGTGHPNAFGQRAIADNIVTAIRPTLIGN